MTAQEPAHIAETVRLVVEAFEQYGRENPGQTWDCFGPEFAARLAVAATGGFAARPSGDPDPRDLVHELREALGWPAVALPISPKQAWEQALAEVRRLRLTEAQGAPMDERQGADTVLPDDDWDAFTCHRCLRDYQFCECEDDEQSDGRDDD